MTYRPLPRLVLAANVAASTNRIREYRDTQSSDSGVLYRDVEPLLTPRLVTAQRLTIAASRAVDIALEHRYQSRAFLQNTSDPRFVLPASSSVDATLAWRVGGQMLTVRGNNLTNSRKYGSGYASGGVPYYYVVPPRNLFATLKITF